MKNVITLLIVAFILTTVWFHKGLVLGGGEAGVPFYNFQNELSIHSNAWVEKGLGNPTGIVTALSPFFNTLSFLQNLGFSPTFLQASLFLILLSTSFIGIYLLVRSFSPNPTIAFFSSLFYNLNLMAMTVVWNRFQYPFMFFYACLPFVLYFFSKGLREKKIIYVGFLNLFVLAFGMIFTSLPLLILFWIVLSFYWLFFVITYVRNKKYFFWTIGYFILGFGIFVLCNFWWLLQFIQTFFASSYLLQEAYATSDNYLTFIALSENLGNLDYLIRLMHRDFFLWMKEVWIGIYQNPLMIILSFLPLIFIFGSVFIKNKPKEYFFFLFLALVSVFFAKGSNDPFGGIFYFLFTHGKLFEAFRNPFEKIGLIIPLGYAPLFGFGLFYFYKFLQEKKVYLAKVITSVLLIAICGVLVWPMWNGWVFLSNEPPANNPKIGDYIKIPSYYKDANDWLNKKPEDFRTIALPLKGEGLTHIWTYGYNGVDLSSSLFDKQFLGLCTGLEYLCSITNKLQPFLINNPENFWKVLPALNVKYIMVRDDVDYKLRLMHSPQDIKYFLSQANHIKLEKEFDKLSFYMLKDNLFMPKIFGAINGIFYHSVNKDSFIEASAYANYESGDIYMTDGNGSNKLYELAHAKQIVLKAQPFGSGRLDVARENAEAELPFIRFLPDSRFYWYSRLKERFVRFMAGNNYSKEIVIESDKRIIEVVRLVREQKYELAKKTLQEYQSYLQIFHKNPSIVNNKFHILDLLRQKYILADVISQLKNAKQKETEYAETYALLLDILYILNIEQKFKTDLTQYASYKIFIPEDGEYKLILETKDWEKFYASTNIQAIIDAKENLPIRIDPDKKDQIILTVFLQKGSHQIDLTRPEIRNLVDVNNEEYIFKTEQELKNFSFPFMAFDPLGTYNFSFDYYINKGNSPYVFVTHDTDIVRKGKILPRKSLDIELDSYDRDWKKIGDIFTADPIAHMTRLVFEVSPWNDCNQRNTGWLSPRCKNKSFKMGYNKETQVKVKNIVVSRDFNNNLFLIKEKTPEKKLVQPIITYKKINSATYLVDVKNASTPFFLTFLESFHPSWKAYYIDSKGEKKIIGEKNHFLINSFANAWYTEKLGSYQILLEFYPQQLLSSGSKVSLLSILCVLIFIIFLKLKEKYGNK